MLCSAIEALGKNSQHGPFVMNSTEQIQKTLRDYQAGKFEAAAVQVVSA